MLATSPSKSSKPLRVRYAPSPTGLVHVGNLRGALVCYLLARQTGGTFILRLEDTDQERFMPEAEAVLTESLAWLGLDWDEGYGKQGDLGPYVQSQRLDIYTQYAQKLIASGHAYRDYTSSDELAELRLAAQKAGTAFRFTHDQARLTPVGDEPGVIRFRTPDGPPVTWNDAVWGEQSWDRSVLDDFVCIKSDGFPTYNFAVVIDDHLMKIDLVTRGQEFLPTTPKNLLVYAALGWDAPDFAHLPWIMGPDGKTKLSKRHGARSVLEYRDLGYLSDTIVNFLASLGWNDGTEQEIFSRAELIEKFSLDRVQKSNAIFDPERLDWMNGIKIRALHEQHPDELARLAQDFWPPEAKKATAEYKARVLALEYERIKCLSELTATTTYFFSDPTFSTGLIKLEPAVALSYLRSARQYLADTALDYSDHSALEHCLRNVIMPELALDKPGPLFMTLRLALTASLATPGLFELISVLGREVVLRRLDSAIAKLA